MSVHKDNAMGLPLCGMKSGRGNVLNVTADNFHVTCLRCLKKINREESDD